MVPPPVPRVAAPTRPVRGPRLRRGVTRCDAARAPVLLDEDGAHLMQQGFFSCLSAENVVEGFGLTFGPIYPLCVSTTSRCTAAATRPSGMDALPNLGSPPPLTHTWAATNAHELGAYTSVCRAAKRFSSVSELMTGHPVFSALKIAWKSACELGQ